MSQQTMNHRHKQEINAPFRAKSAGVSLVAVLLIGIYYIANVIALLPDEQAVPEGALGLTISSIVLIIVVEIVLQIVLFIGAGRIEDRTERDEVIAAKASRNAYLVMTAGVFATFASMFAELTPFEMASLLLTVFLIAEIVKFASQLFYYQRSR
ncbi:MAG: hypothetical protein RLP44_23325 [Aggregatilineales bacterium]